MPLDIEFHLPFPSAVSPDGDTAEVHTIAWLLDYGLLRNEAEAQYLKAMRLGEAAARWFPEARGDDLNLACDYNALISMVNDQVDSAAGQRAEQAKAICNDLLDLFRSNHQIEPTTPYGAAWCDLWKRQADGMSPAWQARHLRNTEAFIGSWLDDERIHRTFSSIERYMERRLIANSGEHAYLSLAERVGHYEVPEQVLASPLIQQLIEEAIKFSLLPNDVYSAEREESRGETDNILLVIEHATGCTRAQAVADVQAMVQDASERFLLLETEVPRLCDTLALIPPERAAVTALIRAARYIGRGCYDWERAGTARYDPRGAALAIATGYADSPQVGDDNDHDGVSLA
ncbi:terpene synthase family protein [Streptomyces vinaceus]|uniref:terpene synthase family protein n=1 Tax=Streptomyces vinaceus TaxID=1960 RepID=UPI0036CA3248